MKLHNKLRVIVIQYYSDSDVTDIHSCNHSCNHCVVPYRCAVRECEGLGASVKAWVRVRRLGCECEGLGVCAKAWVRVQRLGCECEGWGVIKRGLNHDLSLWVKSISKSDW